jgi:anti-sigma regulatory factor (Ser/Thr protein kinase)
VGTPDPIVATVTSAIEIRHVEDAARCYAAAVGFPREECEEIALAAVELASNLVKHASGGGTIAFRPCGSNGRPGLQIESTDHGPGFADFERALADGYSTAGSLGTGLGTVNRMMDALECHSVPPSGTRIVCQRWVRPQGLVPLSRELEFGAASRAYRNTRENGDAFVIRQWDGMALGGVIDGLGHGQFAQRAAQTARQYIESHFDQPLEALFRGVARACQSTRGVVMALTRIDSARRVFTVANIGNIEVRVLAGDGRSANTPPVRRGVLGLNAPAPISVEQPWTETTLLVMHSDGLRTHWSWKDFDGLHRQAAGTIAQTLLRTLGKIDDDATVLVIRNRCP